MLVSYEIIRELQCLENITLPAGIRADEGAERLQVFQFKIDQGFKVPAVEIYDSHDLKI